MEQITSYLDFREYLHNYYTEKKKSSKFSYREFAKAAGFSSPVFIKLVIEGKANLSQAGIIKLCKAIGLQKWERHYFKNLVNFGQAKTIEDKISSLEKLKSIQASVSVNKLSEDQFTYFSKWYHPVIREIIAMIRFDGDCEKLAGLVNPPVTVKEVEESIELLEKLHLIQKDKNGQYNVTSQFVTSEGMENGTLAIRNVQKTMALFAAKAIDTVAPEKRDISGVSISISEETSMAIRDELQRCRRRIFEIASEDKQCNSVYRVNLHFFPLSEKIPSEQLKSIRNGDND